MFNVQIKTEQPLRPGDIFYDAEGVMWVAINPPNPQDERGPTSEREPLDASGVWHLPDAKVSRDEDYAEIDTLPQPFTLVISLDKVTR